MNLGNMLAETTFTLLQGDVDIDIKYITYDSRKVVPGSVFICVTGLKVDGHNYIEQAIANGAVALLVERMVPDIPKHVTVVQVDNTRLESPKLASTFYGEPSKQMNVVGVTGTNGKTSTTFIVSSVLEYVGRKPAIVGTISNQIGNRVLDFQKTTSTTPEAIDLQNLMRMMVEEQVTDLVMEATSMALEMHRLDSCDIDVGVFTNLTQDHLDDHKTMENYKNAKMKLFDKCKVAIINADDPVHKEIIQRANHRCDIWTYAIDREADIRATDVYLSIEGVRFQVTVGEQTKEVAIKIPGKFSVYNTLAAIGTCLKLGLSLEDIVEGLKQIKGVKGRFQTIPNDKGLSVIVDYAHTPDALENVLSTAKEFTKGKLITVFGCGGDRDATKRPIMGEIAGKLSELCILTSDNPRTEDPTHILNQIEAGIANTDCRYLKMEDRSAAIRIAIEQASAGDVVIIAGKGHEDYQEINGQKIHFDDFEVAQKYISTR